MTESIGGHKQGGRASYKVHHCLCIPERWFMCLGVCLSGISTTHTHTHTGCDTSSEGCNMCLGVTLSFSQTPMICDSSHISYRKRLVYQPAMLHCLSVCCRAMIFLFLFFFSIFVHLASTNLCLALLVLLW